MNTGRRPKTRLGSLLAAMAITGASLLLGLPAHADEPTAGAAPAAPKEAPRVDLILDVSGSMTATDIQGKSRISVAQQSLNEVIDALPPETEFGIRTLGATYPGNDKNIGCQDTKVLFPVGKTNKVEAKTAVATLRPTGWTPMGLALRGAAQDLGKGETTRRVVLITDGEDTCTPPDPCDVARELASQGIHLVVDTLGLAHDDKTRQQLLCIANATGGTYTDVRTPQQLTDKVKQLVDRTNDTYTVTPVKTSGTDKCENAPVLAPGVYSDREKFSEHRVYKVPVKAGQELRASVSVSLDRAVNRDYGVLLQATSATGQELVRGTDAGSSRTDVVSTGLRWSTDDSKGYVTASPTTSSKDKDKEKPDTTVCLVVSNSASPQSGVQADPGMPVELTVDLTAASPAPEGAAMGLGRGWILLLTLTLAGLLFGLVFGWIARWRIAVWREN
ncbi:VWA domain-containing protein [Streptomyces rubellomurinus]|uniref:Inter-alpha-trypsin inhibitor heavy chain H5 n=2 Tax=Streptomyces TaxID=1883 RepID=A0A0F2TEL4_STRR3|nr:VWA domain-containing protein [Streptomyces rubellomurinus]KJS55704.1 Inter-alpha-trypsin inhibitor heavy chain H5 [Streptomyces rubellomurinus subsp. indigoferus]KJS61599.1 Inter-alpha-trypsin inhibitor heavy chain H5 [Streptomyces rubellomurinus]